MTRNMPQDTAFNNELIILDASLDAKSHAVTRIAWTSPASRTKHSWSFPLHAGTHLIRGDALSHRAVLGRAAASRHGSPQPSSDAEASTDRAPRPAVWASTALSSGRVAVRGAGATGGKRGAAGRAGASGETHGRSSRCLYSTHGMRGRNDNDSGGATSPNPFTA